ncbi:MAG: efflux transporter outer membrane subunit [Phycisphaerales bacterium]
MKHFPLTTSVLLAASLSGCTVGPDYHAPSPVVPDAWTERARTDAAHPDGPWWTSFNDPILDDLVTKAAGANTDLRIAVQRLQEARAQRGVVSSAGFPQVDLNGSFSNSRFSENGFLQGLGGSGSGGLPGAIVPGQQINLWQAGVDASWELDLFGRNRRAVQAADADIAADEFGVGDVLVAVIAEVADGYAQLRGIQASLEVAHRTLTSQQETLSVVNEQAAAGVASDLEVSRSQTQVSTTAARIPELESAAQGAIRRLEVLIGAMPGTLDTQLSAACPLPHAPEALDVGIPSEVLRRRPDVRAAERRLAAATARIGVATADLFPRFSLTGSFGLQSQEIGDLPAGDSRFWAIGPSVRWPILDFGRIRSNIRVQDARTAQALAAYEGTVLRALSDVEVSLVRLSRERARAGQLQQAADSARRSVTLATELYRGGLLEFLDLLDAQRTQFLAEEAATQANTAIVTDTVALYRALGGGWENQRAVDLSSRLYGKDIR